jgi:CRP-like cAMP-binding protein
MSIENEVADWAQIPLFAALEYNARRMIGFSGETRILRRDDVVFRQGDASDGGYILLNGEIELRAAEESIPAKIIAPPALIGELALMTQTTRPVTATARTPSAVLKISRDLFQRVLKENPRSARQVRALVEARLAELTKTMGESAARNFADVPEAD